MSQKFFNFLPAFPILALTIVANGVMAADFTPESAAAYALQNNADLASARLGVDQAKARLLGSGLRRNPEIESEIRPNLAGREFSFSVGFSQRFPLTDRLRLEKAVSAGGVTLAENEVAGATRDLANGVRAVTLKIQALQERQGILTKQEKAARDLAASMAKTAAAGETPPLETAQLELEVSQITIMAMQLNAERASLTGALRPLLGCPPGVPIRITGSLPSPALPASSAINPSRHPSYQIALSKAEMARRSIELAKASRWEDLTVGVGYERSHQNDDPTGLGRDNLAILRFSLPLPFKKQSAGAIAESIATADRSTMEATAAAALIRAEAAGAFDEMKTLLAIHQQTTRQLLPQANELENRLTGLQKNGQAALPDVLRARQQRLAFESAALDAKRDFHLARLRYVAASGL